MSVTQEALHKDETGEVVNETQKPAELAKKLITMFSHEGNTVMDACCGTGNLIVKAVVYRVFVYNIIMLGNKRKELYSFYIHGPLGL